MHNLTNVKNFYSDKDLTRFEYVKRCLLLVGLLAVAHILYSLKLSRRNTAGWQWAFDIVVGGILLYWILTKRIVTLISLDFKNRKLVVHYITVSSDDRKLEVPFEGLTFDFKKAPTRYDPKKWTLRISDNKKAVFSIETNEDGFSKETLESLVEELQKITHTYES